MVYQSFLNKKNFIILDLEWHSWRGNYWGQNFKYEKRTSNMFPKLICLGYVKFDIDFRILEKGKIFLNGNREIPVHTKKLTKISEVQVQKNGKNKIFLEFMLRKLFKNSSLFANGNDEEILNINLNLQNQKKFKIINLKKIFKKNFKIPEKYLSSTVIGNYFNIKNQNPHCPLSDALTIYKVCEKIKLNFKKI